MAVRRDALIEESLRDESIVSTSTTSSTSTNDGTTWTGEPWTLDDGPPWPKAKDAEEINSEGTNHRKVYAPRDFDFVTPRAEYWVEDPDRHAPSGSDLARKRRASRERSEAKGVPCQASYLKIKYGGNSWLDYLIDRGICWHYNVEVAKKRTTAVTMRRPDGKDGALAWFDEQGRLQWLDRYGQDQPRFYDGEPKYWEDAPELWETNPKTGERERLPPPESRDEDDSTDDGASTSTSSGSTSTSSTSTSSSDDDEDDTEETLETTGVTDTGGETTVTDYAPAPSDDDDADDDPTTTKRRDSFVTDVMNPDRESTDQRGALEGGTVEIPNWLLWGAGAAALVGAWYAFGRQGDGEAAAAEGSS